MFYYEITQASMLLMLTFLQKCLILRELYEGAD